MAAVAHMRSNDSKPHSTYFLASPSTQPISDSITSSPETKPADLHNPIPEEEEDETASETATEPVTPTDAHHPHDFRDTSNEAIHDSSHNDNSHVSFQLVNSKAPLLVNTAATPPPKGTRENNTLTPVASNTTSQTLSQSRPTSANQPAIKRGLSAIFRRSSSHIITPTAESVVLTHGIGGSDTMLAGSGRRNSARGFSTRISPNTTRSNSPPSPGSPATDGANDSNRLQQSATAGREPHSTQFISGKNKNRSSAGVGIRNSVRWGSTFAGVGSEKQKSSHQTRYRATSVDLENGSQAAGKVSQPTPELTRQYFGFGPDSGTGLKARRMSLNLPDDFRIEIVELHDEFADQSRILGRRNKNLGKGATASVDLMVRKGFGSELYAVKKFRAMQKGEDEEDYEKKIKSEFSIAKSLHHPNIVESIRLCRDKGSWNHVMEYCDQGDLFSLVSKQYLRAKDRAADRACLFKQLVQGVHYLHCHGIAHRDIKLENLLITKDSKLKITDFGVSEVFSGIHPGLRAAGGECGKEMVEVRLCAPAICGSMPYIAPEVVEKKSAYDPRPLDVWSSAVVMIHLIFGGSLWDKATNDNQNAGYVSLASGWEKWEAEHPEGATITDTDYPHVSAFNKCVNPPALRRLLLCMLHPNPAKRSSIEAVAKNRWLKVVECCQINSYDDPVVVIDASKKKQCLTAGMTRVVFHNHLPPAQHKHHLIRLPGATDME